MDRLNIGESMLKLSLLLGAALFVLALTNELWAQEAGTGPDQDPKNPPYPGESHIVFQWNYSCPAGAPCSFTCLGASGANALINLNVYLGTVPTGMDRPTIALFYDFATRSIPHGNGFSISSGMSILSCQVNGMRLDYSGPPK